MLSVFLCCWNVEIKGQLTGQCVLWGLCTRCRCVLGRQWVAVSCGLAACSLRWVPFTGSEGLWEAGRSRGASAFAVQCSDLHMCFHTHFLCREDGQNQTRRLQFHPWWVFLGETLSEAAVSFLYLPLPILGRGRWRSCGGCQTALLTSTPGRYYTYLVSRALWKHISVCSECLKVHSWRSINLCWSFQVACPGPERPQCCWPCSRQVEGAHTGLVWGSCEIPWACTLVPCGKVNLICFLMLLSIMYNNEYAAVHQQKWSVSFVNMFHLLVQEDVCGHREM